MNTRLLLIGSLLLVAPTGCGEEIASAAPDAGVAPDASAPPSLEALYQAAVDDAEIAEADEIVDTLIAISDDNTTLGRDSEGRVLMVTWTSYPGYDDQVGQPIDLAVDVWATTEPELQAFCRGAGLTGSDLTLRLEQLLGLPPGVGKDRVVQLWVPTAAIFRPSPDLEIDDSVAQLDYPENTPQAHIDWIERTKSMSYGPDGYPWTRLGYTYDWNPDTSEVGLSEFIVALGSTVVVESVTTTGEYCRP